jgi:hypothetical protein
MRLMLLRYLHLRARNDATPRWGGSRPGKKRSKDMQRMNGAMMLASKYFADNATHTPKEFWRRFRMNI